MRNRISLWIDEYFSKEFLIMLLAFSLLRFLMAFLFPVFGDACRYFMIAKTIYVQPSLLVKRGITYPTPLFLLISAFFYGMFIPFGEKVADLSLRLVSPLFGSLTIVFVYLIAKKMFDEKIALFSTILFGLSPSHVLFSSIGYMEGLFLFLVSLSLYFLVKDDSEPPVSSYGFCGLTLGLASLTRQTGLLVVAVLVLFTLFYSRTSSRVKRLKATLILLGGAFIIAGPWYLDQLQQFGSFGAGQILPVSTTVDPLSLDSLIYRVDVQAPRSVGAGDPSIYYQPWFRIIGIYYEFWGIWGGAFSVLLHIQIPLFDPLLLLIGFSIVTLFLSIFYVLGVISSIRKGRATILHLLTISTFLIFLLLIIRRWVEYGDIHPSLGYRKPLIVIAPILAIYGGRGLQRFLEIGRKVRYRHTSKLLLTAVFISLFLCLSGLCLEGVFMREKYQERLLGGIHWIEQNTSEDAVILTPRALEIAYLSGRRTMAMYLVQASAINQEILLNHNVSYILIPKEDPARDAYLNSYIQRFHLLQHIGFLEETYQDSFVLIFKTKINNL